MNDTTFWNKAWISDTKVEEVKMIDLLMHKSAVDLTYNILGDIQGKKLLEIGCGSGAQTIDFITKGAKVTAIDISEESVLLTKQFLKKNKLSAEVKQINAEEMDLPDNSFDVVYINCVLMHAHQDKTIKESLRVLKEKGILVFKESLQQWIAAFPYRVFSPYMKAKPQYMTLKKIKTLQAKHREFYLFASYFAFLFFLFKNKKSAHRLFSMFEPIDTFLLKHIPLLRSIAWVSVGTITKK